MPEVSPADIPLIVLAGLAAIFFVWIAQMPSSLWIDELGTFWVIDGDLASTASRAWRFQGQTPFYYAVLWGVTQLLGTSEVVLRLPSLLTMLATAFLLYRFSRRLFGSTAAIVTLAVFVVYPKVGVYAGDARPYALALLATLIATMLLESWLRTNEPKRAAWYGLAAAGVIYVHYVFATIFVVHVLFFAWLISRSEPAKRRRLWAGGVLAGGLFIITTAPTFPQIKNLLDRSDELVFSVLGDMNSVVEIWTPPLAAVVLLCVVALVVGGGGHFRQLPSDPLILMGLAFVVPPLILFVLSHLSGIVLWTPRYWFVTAPFGAILFGALITSGLRNARSLKIAILAVLLVGIPLGTSFAHSPEDWRSAASLANSITDSDSSLLLFSGLIELTSPEFLADPEKRSYVSSPVNYYPIDADVTPLPWVSLEGMNDRLASTLDEVAIGQRVVAIVNHGLGSPLYAMSGWFAANGYETATVRRFGSLVLLTFAPH